MAARLAVSMTASPTANPVRRSRRLCATASDESGRQVLRSRLSGGPLSGTSENRLTAPGVVSGRTAPSSATRQPRRRVIALHTHVIALHTHSIASAPTSRPRRARERSCASARAVARIGPIDTSAPTVGHVEEGGPRLLGHTTGVHGVLLVVGSFEKDLPRRSTYARGTSRHRPARCTQ